MGWSGCGWGGVGAGWGGRETEHARAREREICVLIRASHTHNPHTEAISADTIPDEKSVGVRARTHPRHSRLIICGGGYMSYEEEDTYIHIPDILNSQCPSTFTVESHYEKVTEKYTSILFENMRLAASALPERQNQFQQKTHRL